MYLNKEKRGEKKITYDSANVLYSLPHPSGADVVVSNCNLPKDYKVKVPIKKKVDRQNLDAKACQQCERVCLYSLLI